MAWVVRCCVMVLTVLIQLELELLRRHRFYKSKSGM
jgi:hypothetical protein